MLSFSAAKKHIKLEWAFAYVSTVENSLIEIKLLGTNETIC